MNKITREDVRAKVKQLVERERHKQDKKWGIQKHSPEKWIVILMEEVGEACEKYLEQNAVGYEKEMVQVAAVAQAALECFICKMYAIN